MATLYVVATPIGNLEDITLRAISVLKSANLVVCEDTRRTKILLDKLGIRTPLVSYHQHSKLTKIDWIVEQLASGLTIALVSDAGTPGVNDPGGVLVRYVLEMAPEVKIIPIPGPNAGVTLLSVSGLLADRYLFLGYLPKKKGRQTLLKRSISYALAAELPLVLYESPHRIVRTLEDLAELADGQVIIGRELTKQFEELWRGDIADAVREWGVRTIKGEFALILSPKKKEAD